MDVECMYGQEVFLFVEGYYDYNGDYKCQYCQYVYFLISDCVRFLVWVFMFIIVFMLVYCEDGVCCRVFLIMVLIVLKFS